MESMPDWALLEQAGQANRSELPPVQGRSPRYAISSSCDQTEVPPRGTLQLLK